MQVWRDHLSFESNLECLENDVPKGQIISALPILSDAGYRNFLN